MTSALFCAGFADCAVVALCAVRRRLARARRQRIRWKELICIFALALAPLGFSMWLAHLAYHFLTGASVVIPVTQRAASDLGSSILGQPNWANTACRRSIG